MLKQDVYRQHRGLIKIRDKNFSSPGIYKHPKPIIVPLPQRETVNVTKILNVPEEISNPVNSESDILKESVPTKDQKEYLKGNRNPSTDHPQPSKQTFLPKIIIPTAPQVEKQSFKENNKIKKQDSKPPLKKKRKAGPKFAI